MAKVATAAASVGLKIPPKIPTKNTKATMIMGQSFSRSLIFSPRVDCGRGMDPIRCGRILTNVKIVRL